MDNRLAYARRVSQAAGLEAHVVGSDRDELMLRGEVRASLRESLDQQRNIAALREFPHQQEVGDARQAIARLDGRRNRLLVVPRRKPAIGAKQDHVDLIL